ncbi:Signal peptide protein [Planctomycetales bacterium 10988]|nr:Signal peptide protein [Planctomycetales bacterium 10988]
MNPSWLCLFPVLILVLPGNLMAFEPCRIDIIEEESGWPVPLVELRTVHHLTFVSDNRGVIAFDAPELMGVETWFFVEGNGYEVPKDGFGYRGVRLTPQPGGHLTIKVQRKFPAKRLGRITGAGLFAESQKLDLESDWQEQGILGCDSVQIAVHRGQLYWAWGDTSLADYPLGLFHMLGATTDLQPLSSFEPPVRLRYRYFTNESGKPRVVGEMPGVGPTWISGFVSLPDKAGVQHLVGCYIKVKPPMTAYEGGLCVWDEAQNKFIHERTLWTKSDHEPEPPLMPDGHPIFWTNAKGKKWILYGDPFPRLKFPATFEAWQNPKAWEPLTPQPKVPTISGDEEISPHRGSIAWNEYRQKWVCIFTQLYGKPSPLGEVWYAEAEEPTGPWGPTIKVLSHANYTFYNPRLHQDFSPSNSPILLFEGTYSKMFSNAPTATPRYDYNQVLYRLDLDELVEQFWSERRPVNVGRSRPDTRE